MLWIWLCTAYKDQRAIKSTLSLMQERILRLESLFSNPSGHNSGSSVTSVILEAVNCSHGLWKRGVSDSDLSAIHSDARCFRFASSQCTFDFRLPVKARIKVMTFDTAPSECAPSSLNISFYSGQEQIYADIVDHALDRSNGMAYKYELENPVDCNRLVIHATSAKNGKLCFCGFDL